MAKQIIIFGGSFNPPTHAHEAIIAACLGLPQFDEVWVMPSGDRADKTIVTSDEHRLAMLDIVKKEVFANNPRLVISRFELGLPRPTRLHRTVHALAKAYPNTTFWFAFGGDAYTNMRSWYKADEFIDSLDVIVFTDRTVTETATGRTIKLQIAKPFQQISSTQVRQAVAQGENAKNWLSPAIATYINRHNLYR
jgi:nicotinate-nucleotide adenylyltransferase